MLLHLGEEVAALIVLEHCALIVLSLEPAQVVGNIRAVDVAGFKVFKDGLLPLERTRFSVQDDLDHHRGVTVLPRDCFYH